MDIDLVYTWVDGNDTKWQEEKSKWEQELNFPDSALNKCRYIDNEELRYSLRSVYYNAPWINKIYIITNGQIPKWLDISHPKIQIINHSEIMPYEALPTFNSEAIETCLANIDGLSEYFIYANDDFFVYKQVAEDFFFNSKGEPILRLVPQNWKERNYIKNLYCYNINYSIKLVANKFGKEYHYEICHNIMPYRKSYFLACRECFKEYFEKTTFAKFRQKDSVQRIIIDLYTLAIGRGELKTSKMRSKYFKIETAYIGLSDRKKMKKRLKINSPTLFCINDNENAINMNRKNLAGFLESMFPKPAPWEKKCEIKRIKTHKRIKKNFKYIKIYSKIYARYRLYKFLSYITFGSIQSFCIRKYTFLKNKIKIIRDL